MTVKLGNLTLDDNLRLDGLETAEKICATPYTSFDGTVDVLLMAGAQKRTIALYNTLNGNDYEGGVFTYGQIETIQSMAEAAVAVTLVHPRLTASVLVLSISDFASDSELANPDDDEWCAATINLIEV